MRVVIDARKLDDFGIGTYVRNLVGCAAALRPSWSFALISAPGASDSATAADLANAPNVEWLVSRSPKYGLSELVTIARQAERAGADVFHSPHYVFPFRLPCPGIVTVHDCIHLRFPAQLPRPLGVLPRVLSRIYAARMMRHAVAAAHTVLTVSETTRADLVELVGAEPDTVRVIPNGCDEYFLEAPGAAEVDAVASSLRLPDRFVLYVGNAKPHKNVDRLVAAFDRIHARSADLRLLIAGSAEPRVVARLVARPGVRFLGRVSREQLRALYHRAEVFAFPSLYEGFGLPPLEAMACGTATVVSDRGALPEVTGDGAVQVDPTSVAAIEAGIRDLFDNPARNAELGARGRRRAATFSWPRAAEATVRVYEQVAGTGGNDEEGRHQPEAPGP